MAANPFGAHQAGDIVRPHDLPKCGSHYDAGRVGMESNGTPPDSTDGTKTVVGSSQY